MSDRIQLERNPKMQIKQLEEILTDFKQQLDQSPSLLLEKAVSIMERFKPEELTELRSRVFEFEQLLHSSIEDFSDKLGLLDGESKNVDDLRNQVNELKIRVSDLEDRLKKASELQSLMPRKSGKLGDHEPVSDVESLREELSHLDG